MFSKPTRKQHLKQNTSEICNKKFFFVSLDYFWVIYKLIFKSRYMYWAIYRTHNIYTMSTATCTSCLQLNTLSWMKSLMYLLYVYHVLSKLSFLFVCLLFFLHKSYKLLWQFNTLNSVQSLFFIALYLLIALIYISWYKIII